MCDESWVHFFEPHTRQDSAHRKSQPFPEKAVSPITVCSAKGDAYSVPQ